MMGKAAVTRSISIESKKLVPLPQFAWTKYVSWARVLLAAAAPAAAYLILPGSPSPVFYGLTLLYFAYALVVAMRGRPQSGMAGLLALFGDTVFFLILASYGGERMLWVASIFYLFLLTEALVFYSALEVAVIVGICSVFSLVMPHNVVPDYTVIVAGLVACAFAVSKRQQAFEIEGLRGRLADAQKTAEKAGELERVRIASDFHDGPLQSFISLQMRLEILRKLMERDLNAGMSDLKQLQALAQTQVRDLRTFLHSMRPVDVDGANLVATARRAAESFQKESGIPVTFLGTNGPIGLPQEMTLEVLQMLREALHNVQKHAGASRVAVALEKTDRGLEISIDDNGHGFGFAGSYSLEELELLRLGPASLKRRARSINADLLLESRPGRGAGVKFRIPLQ